MIKVYIISGFLGSGKTTFIKKLLNDQVFNKTMLLENEFGEIGIDGNLFDQNLKVKEINSGCICCSLKGDLVNALDEIKDYDIDSLIIEPSGVGKLSEVMATIMQNDHFKLASHICMVDASKALLYHKNFKEFFDDQVIGANAIVLSKIDKINQEKLDEVIKMLEMLNNEVEILAKPYLDLDSNDLFKLMTKDICECEECVCDDCDCHEHHHHDHDHEHHHDHHHHHHADEVFNSFSIKTDKVFTYDELNNILNSIKDKVVRAKGIVSSDKLYLYFDISGDDISINRYDASKYGLVTIISANHNIDEIKELFI